MAERLNQDDVALLDELFNQVLNAKQIAVQTADRPENFGDTQLIKDEANALLDKFRSEFKAKLLAWHSQGVGEAEDLKLAETPTPQLQEEWKVTREPDDPMALRVSVGGVEGELGYVVYRGDTEACLRLLKRAVTKLEQHYNEQGE